MQTQQQTHPVKKLTTNQLLLCLPLIALAHIAWYYPLLPNPMASHFGPSGKANGWMSKEGFAIFYLGLMVFYSALFGSMGALLRKIPNELINMPNREYWLAPERRDSTIRMFGHQLALFGIAIGAFFIAIMQTVFLTNLGSSSQLGNLFLVYLIAFLLYTSIWTVQMLKQYRLPDA